jgi:hypothetical protein
MKKVIEDDKLEYFAKEIKGLINFTSTANGKNASINLIELSRDIGAFYDENKNKYNNTQLVYQYIRKKMGGKDLLKMYSHYKQNKR